MAMAPTVLLIEDSADTAHLISGALRAGNGRFEVPTASSGRAGLEYLAGHPSTACSSTTGCRTWTASSASAGCGVIIPTCRSS